MFVERFTVNIQGIFLVYIQINNMDIDSNNNHKYAYYSHLFVILYQLLDNCKFQNKIFVIFGYTNKLIKKKKLFT